MKLAQNPSFRKIVVPWHDSDLFCIVVSVFMVIAFSFGRVGLRLATESEKYHGYSWLPVVLMVLSGIVLATNLVRVLTRMVRRRSEEDEEL